MTGGSPTISQRVAEYVHRLRFEDLPGNVVDKTKSLVAHDLGSTRSTRPSPTRR